MERVAFISTEARYCEEPPFHPAEDFPELPFAERSRQRNAPYGALRELFRQLDFDAAHFGTRPWNPLGHIIQPGQTVVLKPNFVISRHPRGQDLFSVVTHPSLLRALVDYVYIALRGRGRIVVADAPQMDCLWDELQRKQQLDSVQSFYRERFGFAVELYDLRTFSLIDPDQPAYAGNRQPRPGDPRGHTVVNLGEQSAFHGLPSGNYYGADYDRSETNRLHREQHHEYHLSRTILEADTVILVPKMKVHKKVGVTLCLKGLVGTTVNKNCLVHYRVGTPSRGGDQLPDARPGFDSAAVGVQRWLFDHALARRNRLGDCVYRAARGAYRTFIKPLRAVSAETTLQDGGNWHGNDSAWRMTADLTRIFFFADAEGLLHSAPQRQMLCVVDGILAGQGEGPLAPDPLPAGGLVMGTHPVAVDLVTTRLMGLDPERLPLFRRATLRGLGTGVAGPEDVSVVGTDTRAFFSPTWTSPFPPFQPHPAWVGHVELKP